MSDGDEDHDEADERALRTALLQWLSSQDADPALAVPVMLHIIGGTLGGMASSVPDLRDAMKHAHEVLRNVSAIAYEKRQRQKHGIE